MTVTKRFPSMNLIVSICTILERSHVSTHAVHCSPIPEGGDYAWLANLGTGRLLSGSGTRIVNWLCDSPGTVRTHRSSVGVLGFSGGMATSDAVVLACPDQFSGAVLRRGTHGEVDLPGDVDRVAGLPVFFGRGTGDQVILADLIARTGDWMRRQSGAVLRERIYSGLGDSFNVREPRRVGDFLAVCNARPGLGPWLRELVGTRYVKELARPLDEVIGTPVALPGGSLSPADLGDGNAVRGSLICLRLARGEHLTGFSRGVTR
jgi:phospholipase/carboxylesterase